MNFANTLNEILRDNAKLDRSIFHHESGDSSREVTFAELHERALGLLHLLQQRGARRSDAVILYLANNEQFLDGYWASLAGGLVAVPVATGISDEHKYKLLRIAQQLGNPWLYTDRKTLERLEAFGREAGEEAAVAALRARAFLVDEIDSLAHHADLLIPSPNDTAFIQFSSGSTSEPKGVVLTHGNLVANLRSVVQAARLTGADNALSWMPLTHDMGLIGMNFFMYAAGMNVHIMPTELFIRRPLLWLQLADRHHCTVLCSPNFGYRHFLKVLGDRPVDGMNLKHVRILFNGAEPISPELTEEFLERMTPSGLPKSSMYPVYGLAEATLAMTFRSAEGTYRVVHFDRHHLGVGEAARVVDAAAPDALALMGVGTPIPNTEVRFTDEARQALPAGTVGHLEIRGPNVTSGYFQLPDVNARVITADGWLDTGDLGLYHEGEVIITGRAKEIIFVNGQNYYPHDLENIAIRAPSLELGKVVAAACRPNGAEADELTLFVLHRGSMEDFLPTADAVARMVNEHAGLEVAHVVPVKRIPKTTSGKLQRGLLAKEYLDGAFAAEMAEIATLRAQHEAALADTSAPGAALACTAMEQRLKNIIDAAMAPKDVGLDDNLFEVGASSLVLIQIHEEVDRDHPGVVDLTELFDHPTIRALAAHLDSKLG